MAERNSGTGGAPAPGKEARAVAGPAYSTFPHVATHGPRDLRCFHGKPEDWRRSNVRRDFGGKVK